MDRCFELKYRAKDIEGKRFCRDASPFSFICILYQWLFLLRAYVHPLASYRKKCTDPFLLFYSSFPSNLFLSR